MVAKVLCEDCKKDITNENKTRVKYLNIKDYVCDKCYKKRKAKHDKMKLNKI